MDGYNCKGTENTWSDNQCSGALMTQLMMYANSLFDNKLKPDDMRCFFAAFIRKFSPKDVCSLNKGEDGFPDNEKLKLLDDDIKKIVNKCRGGGGGNGGNGGNKSITTQKPGSNSNNKNKNTIITIIIVIIIVIAIIGFGLYLSKNSGKNSGKK